jgi:methylmalonyl-CoA mutase
MRKARAAFTANFFGCAGYHIEDPLGFESPDDAIAAIRDAEPDIVVLCSADEAYHELVPNVCGALGNAFDKENEKPIAVLAGYPKDNIEQYRNAGIDAFIHAKSNVLETLKDFQQKLGIIN